MLQPIKNILKYLDALFGAWLIGLLGVYQRTLSPDHGWFKFKHPAGYCRFQPSCSAYAVDAINKYGALKGLLKTIWRLLRCNPFSKGGYDEP